MAIPAASPQEAIEVFFSYAHQDEGLRHELAKHLRLLERQGVIKGWYDRQITGGAEWANTIDDHLNTARIILLLVSPDFLASDYCYDVELQRAMARHEAGEARVIPIILRAVDWHRAPFGKLQALPTNGHPVTSWQNQDEAFLEVTQGIRMVAEELTQGDDRVNLSHRRHEDQNETTLLAGVPTSPDIFIGREDDLILLKAHLGIGGASDTPILMQVLTAVRGWPGIGKTSIATVLARDADIAKQFTDGVLWTSLGPKPNLIAAFLFITDSVDSLSWG